MRKARSRVLVYPHHSLAQWSEGPPDVERARPASCPCCEQPSRPVGRALNVIGHGLRDRMQVGPPEPGGEPAELTIRLRRYLCRACGAVLEVVPATVAAGRRYTTTAVAWALALFCIEKRSAAAVRERVAPGRRFGATAAAGWAQLRRWVRAVRARTLFAVVRAAPATWTCRQIAERAASTLASWAPPEMRATHGLGVQAWHGALRAR